MVDDEDLKLMYLTIGVYVVQVGQVCVAVPYSKTVDHLTESMRLYSLEDIRPHSPSSNAFPHSPPACCRAFCIRPLHAA
jgi:hypothetical protein